MTGYNAQTGEIYIYDVIWDFDSFAEALNACVGDTITLRINSPGGDPFTAIVLVNRLKTSGKTINVIVDGIAASAASIIMCAGDNVKIYPGSMIMLHEGLQGMCGWFNRSDMQKFDRVLDAIDGAIASVYAAKTGRSTDEMRELMTAETWLYGESAVESGFADEYDTEYIVNTEVQGDALVCDDTTFDLTTLSEETVMDIKNVLETIKNKFATPATGEVAETVEETPAVETTPVVDLNEQALTELAERMKAESEADVAAAVLAERKRLEEIDAIAASIPDKDLVYAAKYGDNPVDAKDLSLAALTKAQKTADLMASAVKADAEASNAEAVKAAEDVDEDEARRGKIRAIFAGKL